jgi:hypothetical protein
VITERVARVAMCAALFVAMAACVPGCPKPGPAPVTPTAGDAAPATCLDLCRHGAQLACPWAADTPAGATCLQVCANNQGAGIAPWDLSCRVAASVCDPPGCR